MIIYRLRTFLIPAPGFRLVSVTMGAAVVVLPFAGIQLVARK